jgi:release factor glutamine methyltransferase
MSKLTVTLKQALQTARAQGLDSLDAQVLLANILQKPRTWLLAHDDEKLDVAAQHAFDQGLKRRCNGEPLAYVLGQKEFHGLMLQVNAHVLVPRPETEVLVDWACEILQRDLSDESSPDVIDLGTGSGAIALALAAQHPHAKLCATDVSGEALAVARANAAQHGLKIETQQGSWWQALAANRRFHLAVSNPPYIVAGDVHLDVLRFEPLSALSPGEDGLSALRSLIENAPVHLHDGAWLLLEHGFDQAQQVQEIFHQKGWRCVQTRNDLSGQPRCTGARRSA